MANSRALAWFVTEFPEGYAAPGTASCGFEGNFQAEGQIDDRYCGDISEPMFLGGRGCFAVYVRSDHIVNSSVMIDDKDRVLSYLRTENLTKAALRFVQYYGLSPTHMPALRDLMILHAEGIEYGQWLGVEELASVRLISSAGGIPVDASVALARELGGEAKMYRILDGNSTPRFIFKDRSEFWAVQHRGMWGRQVTLTSILRPIIREAYIDDLMAHLGFPDVYEPAWPAALCLDTLPRPQTCRGGGEFVPRGHCHRKILGLLQRYVPVALHSPSDAGGGANPVHFLKEGAGNAEGTVLASNALAGNGPSTGSIRALLRSQKLAPYVSFMASAGEADAKEDDDDDEDRAGGSSDNGRAGRALLRSIRQRSFDALAVFWFVSGHPDLHGGNILLDASGHVSCIDADMALEGAPGCMMGPLQMPCIFSAIDGFSAPCPFSRWPHAHHNMAHTTRAHDSQSMPTTTASRNGDGDAQTLHSRDAARDRHLERLLQRPDACPQFPQADAPFQEATARLVRQWDVSSLDAVLFSNATLILKACQALRIQEGRCPHIGDIFEPHVYAMFRMRLEILQQIMDTVTPIRALYAQFLRLYVHRILGANISSYFSIDHFQLRNP